MRPIIIGNWKCNPSTLAEAERLFKKIKNGIKNIKNAEIVICPPFPFLSSLKSKLLNLKLGAQDCFGEEGGAFTGEVSPKMLKDLGVEYVILGHSERRKYSGETDETINKKLKKILEFELSPILCIGDKNRESKDDIKEISLQLEAALQGLESADLSRLVVVYEPIWAISTTKGGVAATIDDAKEAVFYIRNILAKLFREDITKKIRIIYGGSVDSENSRGYIKEANFDGLLVGKASLNAKEFIKIIKAAV